VKIAEAYGVPLMTLARCLDVPPNVNSKASTPHNKACLPNNKFDGIVTP